VSIVGGLLTTLQTFHNYSNLAERRKTAAGKYMSIRRRLELLLVRYGPMDASFREQALKELESINQELDDLSTDSPAILDTDWDRARADLDVE